MCLGTAFAADLYWTKHPRESGSSRFVNTSLIAASACRFPLLPSSRRPPYTHIPSTREEIRTSCSNFFTFSGSAGEDFR